PRAVNDTRRPRMQQPLPGPAPVVGIRVEPETRSRNFFGTIAAGLLACMALVTVFRDGAVTSRLLARQSAAHVDLPFTVQDDYASSVRRIGPPAHDEWQGGTRRLWYPRHAFTLILAPRYTRAVDTNGRVIHSVRPQ